MLELFTYCFYWWCVLLLIKKRFPWGAFKGNCLRTKRIKSGMEIHGSCNSWLSLAETCIEALEACFIIILSLPWSPKTVCLEFTLFPSCHPDKIISTGPDHLVVTVCCRDSIRTTSAGKCRPGWLSHMLSDWWSGGHWLDPCWICWHSYMKYFLWSFFPWWLSVFGERICTSTGKCLED